MKEWYRCWCIISSSHCSLYNAYYLHSWVIMAHILIDMFVRHRPTEKPNHGDPSEKFYFRNSREFPTLFHVIVAWLMAILFTSLRAVGPRSLLLVDVPSWICSISDFLYREQRLTEDWNAIIETFIHSSIKWSRDLHKSRSLYINQSTQLHSENSLKKMWTWSEGSVNVSHRCWLIGWVTYYYITVFTGGHPLKY